MKIAADVNSTVGRCPNCDSAVVVQEDVQNRSFHLPKHAVIPEHPAPPTHRKQSMHSVQMIKFSLDYLIFCGWRLFYVSLGQNSYKFLLHVLIIIFLTLFGVFYLCLRNNENRAALGQ
jgi:hypothetical protein